VFYTQQSMCCHNVSHYQNMEQNNTTPQNVHAVCPCYTFSVFNGSNFC